MNRQGMNPSQLLDHFRDSIRALALAEEGDKPRLQREADLTEEEILRRMAW